MRRFALCPITAHCGVAAHERFAFDLPNRGELGIHRLHGAQQVCDNLCVRGILFPQPHTALAEGDQPEDQDFIEQA